MGCRGLCRRIARGHTQGDDALLGLLAQAVKTYEDVVGSAPDIHVSQCSLELGMFSQKVPGLETISIGTELHDLHSPNESVNYRSVAKTWPLVRELVGRLG